MGRRRSSRVNMISIICIFFFLVSSAHSFYLPGVAPRDFPAGDLLSVKVNKLSSTKTQLPYDYYYLHYCKPSKILNSAENLGEVLRGDRIENSVFTFHMRQELPCQVACRVKLDNEAAKNFKEKIDDEYRVNMILDNLPVAVLRQRRDVTQPNTYEHGFRVGFKGNYAGSKVEKYFINNHLSFRVMYHKDPETDTARIVGFEVTPNSYKYVLWSDLLHTLASVDSINHEYKEWDEKNPQVTTCTQKTKDMIQGSTIPQEVDTDKEVIFTYDVSFKESDIKWASRWDTYLLMNDDQIHWFSIINSLMIVLFLSGMVAMIMMRTLYKDIANYNQLETQDEAQEETGWKLVHGDVFRPPINSGLLCVYVGTGVQIFAMTLVTMMFAVLGFLSPSNRGSLHIFQLLFKISAMATLERLCELAKKVHSGSILDVQGFLALAGEIIEALKECGLVDFCSFPYEGYYEEDVAELYLMARVQGAVIISTVNGQRLEIREADRYKERIQLAGI
nr:transmembrane 9 superfamily member 7-like [Ipomoea batatas]